MKKKNEKIQNLLTQSSISEQKFSRIQQVCLTLNQETMKKNKKDVRNEKKSKPSDTEQHKRTEVLAHPTGLSVSL